MNRLRITHAPNTQGRDFVIGDLHGQKTMLTELLRGLKFNPETDRLFSVGDLVDRGEDSLSCLYLIQQPWVHAVMANHEAMMLEAIDNPGYNWLWQQNGGTWASAEELALAHADLIEQVRTLPYIRSVQRKDGQLVNIIHAEWPWAVTDAELDDPDTLTRITQVGGLDGTCLIWNRDWFMGLYGKDRTHLEKLKRSAENGLPKWDMSNMSITISGHTPLMQPTKVGKLIGIDTGASMGRPWSALTAIDINTLQCFQQSAAGFKVVDVLDMTPGDAQ